MGSISRRGRSYDEKILRVLKHGTLKQQEDSRKETEFNQHPVFQGCVSCFLETHFLANPTAVYVEWDYPQHAVLGQLRISSLCHRLNAPQLKLSMRVDSAVLDEPWWWISCW